jgi:hypothetical protein
VITGCAVVTAGAPVVLAPERMRHGISKQVPQGKTFVVVTTNSPNPPGIEV